jgi:hypothetical protein
LSTAALRRESADAEVGSMKRSESAKQLPERALRADRLRRACHALRPSDARPGRLPSARRLRDLVGSVRAAAEAGTPAAVEALDRQLEETTRQVVASIAEISIPQLRATLPEVRDESPDEIAALIDVCLDALEQRPDLWAVIEYLVTLLASTATGRRREVTTDPTTLTELLHKRCSLAGPADGMGLEALRGDLLDAVDELDNAVELAPILDRLRARKDEHREALLVPDVLRALVAYNVAVGNRLATLLGAEKALDDADPVDGPLDAPTPAQVSTVLAHAGVRALQRGIAAQANGIPVEPGAVFRIVGAIGMDRIDARESNLLLAEQRTASEEIVVAALVLGLLDERIERVAEEDIDELLLDRARLDRDWLPSVERELARCIEAALAAGEDVLAQQLAESKAKYLGHRRPCEP